MAGRFDHIAYDDESQRKSFALKVSFQQLADNIQSLLPEGRGRALALTKLEEAFTWIGKAIRDEQVQRESLYAP